VLDDRHAVFLEFAAARLALDHAFQHNGPVEIQRGNLVTDDRAVTTGHAHQAGGADAHPLARRTLPDKRPRHDASLHVQFAAIVAELARQHAEPLAVDDEIDDPPVAEVEHHVTPLRIAGEAHHVVIGLVIVDAVEEHARIGRLRESGVVLLVSGPQPHEAVGQGQQAFPVLGPCRVDARLGDGPRLRRQARGSPGVQKGFHVDCPVIGDHLRGVAEHVFPADADGLHSRGQRRLDAGVGVLEHQAMKRGYAQPLGRQQKDLRIRFGPAEIVTGDHRVKQPRQVELVENRLGVLARRTEADLDPLGTKSLDERHYAGI